MRLLILGDSAAAGVGATRQEEGFAGQLVSCLAAQFTISWKLLAKTGATTGDTLDSLENTGAEPFDVVVVSLGVNDLTSGHQRWLWLKRQAKLIDLLNTKFEARLILLSGLPPMHLFPALPQPLRWYMGLGASHFNAGLHKMVNQLTNCRVLSVEVSRQLDGLALEGFASDGFHPGPAFYKSWAKHLAEEIVSHPNIAIHTDHCE